MSIEATCGTCDRKFLLEQIGPESDNLGRCPFCGTKFGRHYTTVLVEAVKDAEISGQRFVNALGRLQGMETGFEIDIDGALEDTAKQIRAHERKAAS